jgi:hypothetical protein
MFSSKILNLALFGVIEKGSLPQFKKLWSEREPSNIFDQKVLRYAITRTKGEIVEFLLSEGVGYDWIPEPNAEENECPCINCDSERLSAHGIAGRLPFDSWEYDVKRIVDLFNKIKSYENYQQMGVYHGWVENPEVVLEEIGTSANEKPDADAITGFIKLIQEHWIKDEEKEVRSFVERYPNQLPAFLIQALRARCHRAVSNLIFLGVKVEETHFQEVFSNGNPVFFSRSEDYFETVQIIMAFGLIPDLLTMRAAFELGDAKVFAAIKKHYTGGIEEIFNYSAEEDDLQQYGEIALKCVEESLADE